MISFLVRNMNYKKEWSPSILPVIILTFTPRFRALVMVSALSCLGGSKSGSRPTNCHGAPGLSLFFSGTSCYAEAMQTAIDEGYSNNY